MQYAVEGALLYLVVVVGVWMSMVVTGHASATLQALTAQAGHTVMETIEGVDILLNENSPSNHGSLTAPPQRPAVSE